MPGFLLFGFGVGLTFVAISVTAMSEIHPERAGLASGSMTTAHESGGALGVSIPLRSRSGPERRATPGSRAGVTLAF